MDPALIVLALCCAVFAFLCSPLSKCLDHLDEWLKWPFASSGGPRQPTRPRLEFLELRDCPAGIWSWNGAWLATSDWSNPTGGTWLHNGAATVAGQYPGKAGSTDDQVRIMSFFTGNAKLDVALANPLKELTIGPNWAKTLTVTAGDLRVEQGTFSQESGTIDLTTKKLYVSSNTDATLNHIVHSSID